MGTRKTKGKIAIIGAGFVGASTAFSIATSGIASEMVLIDVNVEKAIGEVMDLNHGLSFYLPLDLKGGIIVCKDADVIIFS